MSTMVTEPSRTTSLREAVRVRGSCCLRHLRERREVGLRLRIF